uniref:Uncharacterized protein n=1 Tax=Arundo donax TaxID=35708 RepID=A0A0A9E248_ARUDO
MGKLAYLEYIFPGHLIFTRDETSFFWHSNYMR